MNTVTKSDIIAAGYRMSANTGDAIVTRCASSVRANYLDKFILPEEIAEATTTSEIGKCWIALTFLRLLQDDEFATRTGGEVKNNQYGSKVSECHTLKAECAAMLRKLAFDRKARVEDLNDICQIWLRSQVYF